MIREVTVRRAFGEEWQPDGTSVRTLDGYQGCQLECPYCFQRNDPEWSKEIQVRTNIVEVLKQDIQAESAFDEPIFIGSLSDPYMPLESDYGLTRQLLEVLSKTEATVYIVTKSDNQLVLRDVELLQQFNKPVSVILGLANIKQADKGAAHCNIKVANELRSKGIHVEVHITPVLPYIMKVEQMIDAIDPEISICIDKLRIFKDGNQDKLILEWIKKCHPSYLAQYEKIVNEGDEEYYKELLCRYKEDKRVGIVFE